MKKILFILFIFSSICAIAQNKSEHVALTGKGLTDSLYMEFKKSQEDSNKVNICCKLAWGLMTNNPDSAFYFANIALSTAQKINFQKGIATSYMRIGIIYYYKANYPKALDNYFEALKINEDIGNKKGISGVYCNIGIIYMQEGNYPEALKSYNAALKVHKELNDKMGIAGDYNNIAGIYAKQANYADALTNFLAVLKIYEELGDKNSVATVNDNIGAIYVEQSSYIEAINYHHVAKKIYEELGNKNGIANSTYNIGIVYFDEGNYQDALKYHAEALKIREEIGDKNGIGMSRSNIGLINEKQGHFQEALKQFQTALKIFEEIGNKSEIAEVYGNIGLVFEDLGNHKEALNNLLSKQRLCNELRDMKGVLEVNDKLSEAYEKQGQFQKALICYKAYKAASDSIFNNENTKKSVQSQMQYDYDKKDAVAKVNQIKKDALAKEKLKREQLISYSGIAGVIILLVFSSFVYRNLRVQKNLNKIITQLISDREKTIDTRTAELRVANQKLIGLINYNAHNIREPLTRIMGVMGLREYVTDAEFMETYWTMMAKSVQDLDVKIKTVIADLEEVTEVKT